MGFIFTITEGMLGAAAATDGLAGVQAGLAGPAAAAGAVVPPGLDEISLLNAARISAHAAQVAAMLAQSSAVKAAYGTSIAAAGVTYTLVDAMSEAAAAALTVV